MEEPQTSNHNEDNLQPGLTNKMSGLDENQQVAEDGEASFKQGVEGLLLCPVCHETVTDPRVLNCGHFFCSECTQLLVSDNDTVHCSVCQEVTQIPTAGLKAHLLAAELVYLLDTFSPNSTQEITDQEGVDNLPPPPPLLNGVNGHRHDDSDHSDEDSINEGDEELKDITSIPDVHKPPQHKNEAIIEPPADYQSPSRSPGSSITVEAEVHSDPESEHESPDDNKSVKSTTDSPSSSEDEAKPKPSPNTNPASQLTTEPLPAGKLPPQILTEQRDQVSDSAQPEAQKEPTDTKPTETDKESSEVSAPEKVIINVADPSHPDTNAVQVQVTLKPDENQDDTTPAVINVSHNNDTDELEAKIPVEHAELASPTKETAPTSDFKKEPENEKPKLEDKEKSSDTDGKNVKDEDETDRGMKPSEKKPSDVKIEIEKQRQCENCYSIQCTCNESSLLTPSVSMGSCQSVDQNNSPSAPSDPDLTMIPIRQKARWVVDASASNIEIANKNRIHISRWTYDDNGSIATFDDTGKKIKFIQKSKHNYSGVTISKLGFIFAINTSKHRIEEYSGSDGKRVKTFKLDSCKDPWAIDIMGASGNIVVVDQDANAVIIYYQSKGEKPKIIKHELLREPYDVACTKDGFFVTCASTKHVLKFDLDGDFLWSYDGTKEGKSQLGFPQGICVDEDGTIYVVDKQKSSILVLNSDGEVKGRLYDKEKSTNRKPWYISVKDNTVAILFDHNVVKTYDFV